MLSFQRLTKASQLYFTVRAVFDIIISWSDIDQTELLCSIMNESYKNVAFHSYVGRV